MMKSIEYDEWPARLLEFNQVNAAGSTSSEPHTAPPRLAEINFQVTKGEWVYLVGVNGSGKSTLARLLAGLSMEGVTGSIDRGFAGEHPSPYVMQQPDAQLFGQTPREELGFALEWMGWPPAEIEERTTEVLQQLGLERMANFTWDELSGGQRQLTAVAAAAAGHAPLIVFDEATSMLDDEARSKVRKLAQEQNKQGTAVIWVTQRLTELTPGSRVVALREGRIIYDGEARTFMYGADASETPPCVKCGLRLPYLPAVALDLWRKGVLGQPLPLTPEEWQVALT